jgi:hypothetical protein
LTLTEHYVSCGKLTDVNDNLVLAVQLSRREQSMITNSKPKSESPRLGWTYIPLIAEQPEQTASSIYSAPVSRQVGGGSVPTSPRSVTLTTAEREAARMSGISEMEYARNKILLMQRQARGEVQK